MNDGQIPSMVFESPQLLSRQGLDMVFPARGQLHRIAANEEILDTFAYVIAVENGMCDIVFGSKDALMASATDIVLPSSVLGDYVMLSPDLRAKVPVGTLGRGFASLDECVCGKIDQALKKFDEDEDDLGFVRGYPYFSMFDDRIAYRLRMSKILIAMERKMGSDDEEPGYALAAENKKAPVGANCRVDGLDGMVLVRHVPADNHLMLRVLGADGNRSQALDGWGVFGKDAELLGMIEGATLACEVPDGFDCVLTLVDADGGIHPLRGGDGPSKG